MESSRVFVRGLPPTLSPEEFKKHFSKVSATTDAKLFPHRRIGYVGYSSHDEASKAVKYFNKSYIRMSRIQVELAKPVVTSSAQQTSDQEQAADTPTTNPKESLAAPKRKHRNISGDGGQAMPLVTESNANIKATYVDKGNREENEASKRRKKSQDQPANHLSTDLKSPLPKAGSDDVDSSEDTSAVGIDKESKVETSLSENPPASDADWLRSRTSRLLGLLEDDEIQEPISKAAVGEDHESSDGEDEEPRVSGKDSVANGFVELEELEPIDVQAEKATNKDVVPTYSRLFLRNLAYDITESDLREYFDRYGFLEEVSVPRDFRSNQSKGFAFVQFLNSDNARSALKALDGQAFHGRLLHIMPSPEKKLHALDDFEISKLPLKKQKQIRRKAQAASSSFEWNSLYMNADAVMSSISDRLGIAKSELLDPTSSSSAVKQAHAETSVIQETKSYLSTQGVNVESFKTHGRIDSVILVKNFPYGTNPNELKELFEAYGVTKRVILPPSGTIAVIEFETPVQGKAAFNALAYRKFKDSVLFLEKGPRGIFDSSVAPVSRVDGGEVKPFKPSTNDLLTNGEPTSDAGSIQTLYVKNLSFSTTTEKLRETFTPLDGYLSARVKTKPDPKIAGNSLSMGFGFVEFQSKAQANAAMAAMNGYKLDGHDLLIRASHRGADAAEERKKMDNAKKIAGRRTKIIIKNLPFEASKKDVRSLFGVYGKLRSVRVPRKFDNSTRGFAFADFVTAREAENAMDALSNTHLLGRRLVLSFAAEDSVDPEEEIEKMQKKMGKQADKIAIQKLTGSGRKKFNVEGQDEDQL